jgi:hypothetical protein
MRYNYSGTWAHLNEFIMALHVMGLGYGSIMDRIYQTDNPKGRFGDMITKEMIRYIILKNLGKFPKQKKPEYWEVWTPERQYAEFVAERTKAG